MPEVAAPQTATPFRISANAASRIAEIARADGNPALKLRISVSGGGCSGFQYGFTLDETQTPEDVLIEAHGVGVLVDQVSLDYLKDAEIDFVRDLTGASFQVKNPNATSSCGCGNSFSV